MIQLSNTTSSTTSSNVSGVTQSMLDLFRIKDARLLPTQNMHRPIPAPEPNPEPNPAPDAGWEGSQPHDNISPADWDELFHAVQTRLEQCVDDALLGTPQLAPQDRHAVTKTAVLECVQAMTQLHASLTLERRQRQAHQLQQAQDQHRQQH